MWRAYNEDGALAYSFIESVTAMKPYYYARALGGFLFFAGSVVCLFNIWKTIRINDEEQVIVPDKMPVTSTNVGLSGVKNV